MTRAAQTARLLNAAAVDARARAWGPVPLPDMTAFDRPGFVEIREHLASLSPERRAVLDAEWRD